MHRLTLHQPTFLQAQGAALGLFNPFLQPQSETQAAAPQTSQSQAAETRAAPAPGVFDAKGDLDELKRQIAEMQRKLEGLSKD